MPGFVNCFRNQYFYVWMNLIISFLNSCPLHLVVLNNSWPLNSLVEFLDAFWLSVCETGMFRKISKFPTFVFSSFGLGAYIINWLQVELMRMQLKRAKRRTDTQDMELAMDMMVVFS